MRLVFGCLVLASCGGGADPPLLSDAATSSDAPSTSDAQLPTTGIVVRFSSNPSTPGQIRDGVTVTSATFRVRSLEVVGDGGSDMTKREDVELAWGPLQPASVTFPDAPPALYSQITLDIDGDLAAPSYEILGMARVAGTMQPYRITDIGRVQADVSPFDRTLSPGGQLTLAVELDLRDALNLDFGQLRNDGGVWTLDQTDGSRIAKFREDLEKAFDPE